MLLIRSAVQLVIEAQFGLNDDYIECYDRRVRCVINSNSLPRVLTTASFKSLGGAVNIIGSYYSYYIYMAL